MDPMYTWTKADTTARNNPTRENCAKAALIALEHLKRQKTPTRAWSWAEIMGAWAIQAGIPETRVEKALGNYRWPRTVIIQGMLLLLIPIETWEGQ